MTDNIISMAKTISEQETRIKKLQSEVETYKSYYEKTREERDNHQREILKLRREVEKADPDTVKLLKEAHGVLMAENEMLHQRYDAMFEGVAIDAAAKKRYLKSIVERLDGIKKMVEAIVKEDK